MLRWAVRFALNRLWLVLVILLAAKAFGVTGESLQPSARGVFGIALPFEILEEALK